MNPMQTVMVPGPLHPDLFDGETPMLVPVEVPDQLRLFRVQRHASVWIEREFSETYHLLAIDDDDAYEKTYHPFDERCEAREKEMGGGAQVDLNDDKDKIEEIPFDELGKHFSDAADFLQQLVNNHVSGECQLDEDHLPWTPGMAA